MSPKKTCRDFLIMTTRFVLTKINLKHWRFSFAWSQMCPTMFKPSQIQYFILEKWSISLGCCCFNFQDRTREETWWSWQNVTWIKLNHCSVSEGFCQRYVKKIFICSASCIIMKKHLPRIHMISPKTSSIYLLLIRDHISINATDNDINDNGPHTVFSNTFMH